MRLLLSLVLTGCFSLPSCSSDDAAANRRTVHAASTAEPAKPSPPDRVPVAITPESAEPYFKGGKAKEAAEHYALERWPQAEAAFLAAAKSESSPKMRARALLMAGLSQSLQKKWAPAAATLEQSLPELPLLADYIHYQIARCLYFARESAKAMSHAEKVSSESIVGADAELLVGDLLRARGNWAVTREHYQSYRKRRPKGIRRAEVRYREARAIEELVRSSKIPGDELHLALKLLREIGIVAPLSPWAERAQKRIKEILRNPPSAVSRLILRAARAPLSGSELITRGMVYYDAMRNPLSEADFASALEAKDIDAEQRCVAAYHRANSVFKQRQRKRAAPLFDAALAVCKKTKNADLKVKSAYQAGRSYANIRKRKKAIDRYRQVEKMHPEHSYADDARLRQAEEYRDLAKEDKVTELLASIPKVYPKGDMRAEAMWRLAWRAIKKDDFEAAIKWLEKQIAVKPIDDNYWAEGQAQYWLGRAHGELGKSEESAGWYEKTIDAYPMSYYALLALNRLRESHPARFAKVEKRIAPTPQKDAKNIQLRPRAVYGSPGFGRALEFLRLGLGSRAEAELRRLKLASPKGKKRVDDPDEIDRIWALAYLYHRAKRYEHSHWVTRWHVLDYKRHWPRDGWRMHWDIAYPRAWWPLLSKWSDERGHPTELQIAFVREESAFDPLRESYANAIGLTQMIFSTARRFAKGTGIEKVTREVLRDPEKNVTIGSNFLAFLMRRFENRVGLVVPSYNAGEGATFRWLRARGSWPQDEWAEEIPYDQARRYSKRVIASYFAYSFLRDGTIPVMPNDIPKSVLP